MAQIPGQEDKEKTTALKDLLSRIDLDELMKKDEPPLTFPKTLEEFEYTFNERKSYHFYFVWMSCMEMIALHLTLHVVRII
ncbi:unnamed protein product [Oncorhynchus mykiss]|uniref:Uncharacterized protein n=1 Tax=Oncorhynchus mykiss TaxID=8022 RepID=A0A060Z1K6_ONCMY|nr:unnamed protein product [Oncorhynchus mykiss]